ncbi:MAG TPA: 2Fe-2S iron-sulfur cluster-binding protein, partial [Aggregatilineales bacterium]|nr:2Fe-2S iron-sulfur cluster-binding protein [Aggregatilineales bacterium]
MSAVVESPPVSQAAASPSVAGTQAKRVVRFSIYRYDPDKDAKPYMQNLEIELLPTDKMLLDALMRIRQTDDSISFRRSCREGVCGSDAININGNNGLACIT